MTDDFFATQSSENVSCMDCPASRRESHTNFMDTQQRQPTEIQHDEQTEQTFPTAYQGTVDLKDFAKYLHYVSFDEELHRIRRMSWESVLASERLIGQEPQSETPPTQKAVNV